MLRLLFLALAWLAVGALWRRANVAPLLATKFGRLLRNVRSGDARAVSNDPALRDLPLFEMHSDGFSDGGQMQPAYVNAHGEQPPLRWSGEPDATVELALIVEDIDVPLPAPLVHAIAYGIDPARRALEAGAIPPPGHLDRRDPTIALGRGAGGQAFLPPTPIPGHGPHRYAFQAFALRERLVFDRPPNKARMLRLLRERAVARATVIGTHENP